MRVRKGVWAIGMVLVVSMPLGGICVTQDVSPEECDWTAKARVYSSAYYVEEAGDVVGEELAMQVHDDKSLDARLYDYEGAPNTDGIKLTGRISARKVSLQGDWLLRSYEMPSKKEVVDTRHVEVAGTLDGKQFRGTITISGMATRVVMKRVAHIWMCGRAK